MESEVFTVRFQTFTMHLVLNYKQITKLILKYFTLQNNLINKILYLLITAVNFCNIFHFSRKIYIAIPIYLFKTKII